MVELQDLLFKVEKVQQSKLTVPDHECEILGYLDGKGNEPTILNTCSKKFNLFKNNSLFPVIERLLDKAKCVYKKSYKMNKFKTSFHAVYVIYSIAGKDVCIDLGNDEKIYLMIFVDNSYNGKENARASVGLYREICTNGMVAPYEEAEEKAFTIVGKHTDKLNTSFKSLITKIKRFINMSDVFKKRLLVLTDRSVPNYGERIEEVLKATKIRYTKSHYEFITKTIEAEAKKLYGGTINDFLIYNGINAHIFKAVNSKGNKREASPVSKRNEDRKVMQYILTH